MDLLRKLRQALEEPISSIIRYFFQIRMAAVRINSASSSESQPPVQFTTALSGRARRPLLHLVEDPNGSIMNYKERRVPIMKAALNGNFKDVSHFFENDPELVESAITKHWATALHVAAGANNARFVKELVNIMERHQLELQDSNGNTAFILAAAVGSIPIAEIMLKKNESLPRIRGKESLTPLHLAVMEGKSEMAGFLYPRTLQILEEEDSAQVFFICVNNGIYDLALKMLEYKPTLVYARGENQETALHVLARKRPMDSRTKTQALALVKSLWKTIFDIVHTEARIKEIISTPSHLVFIAAKVGNFEFLVELMSSHPDLIWEVDYDDQSIIHFAVLWRRADIFNIIHEIGSFKDLIVTNEDPKGNNLLHCAAQLAPPDQLNLVSGAAFQLMLELSWFQEVKKIMPPRCMEWKNKRGLTPRELFTKQHGNLLKKAESWMKSTANSCILVSTVIATGVFSSLFSLPGGIGDDNGIPHYLKKPIFLAFVISSGTSVISSSTATLVFLSILISRYAEDDFQKSLPSKLIFGLIMLFIAITSMMVAFSTALFITCYHGLKWVPGLLSVLAFMPVLVFLGLQLKLWYDIIYSTYYCKSLFRPRKRIIRLEL